MAIDYKSGFIDELDRKVKETEKLIEIVKKNRSELENSLKNTKYKDNAEDEIDKIIMKLNNIISVGGCLETYINKINSL